jgi:hypothetical protein
MTAVPQHMQALSVANHVRVARHALKREIHDGDRTAASVLLQVPDEARTMTVYDLLTAQNRWGSYRSRKLLAVAQITDRKTLEALTDRQRQVLVDLLEWGTA